MAAAYRVVVSSVSCYNSVVVDRRTHSHAVHYCSGPCGALSQGLDCTVAHRGTCSELMVTPIVGGSTGNLSTSGSLKDITEEAINLASGKLKEFSFDKLRLSSSSHVTFRKGRKVRPDSFSRRSTDLEIIYGHFSSQNLPPFVPGKGVGQEETNSLSSIGSLDQSLNTVASLYLNALGEENLIARLLEKTRAEAGSGGAGGEDIRACLDILLKCSEDLKKCTDIIKQCIRRKAGGGPEDEGASPDSVYRAVMTRLSSYLKKLPLELEGIGSLGGSGQLCQGAPGSGHSDLAELVNTLHSIQQGPYSPIFGNEQPPRYEDVVQSPPIQKTVPHSASSTSSSVLSSSSSSLKSDSIHTKPVQSSPSRASQLTNGLKHSHPSSTTQVSLLPRGENSEAVVGEEEDGALLLRILESIESFAQELVDSGAGSTGSAERNSGKEREVMRLLQDTLATTGRADTPLEGPNPPVAPTVPPIHTNAVPAIPPKQSSANTPAVSPALTPINAVSEALCNATSEPAPKLTLDEAPKPLPTPVLEPTSEATDEDTEVSTGETDSKTIPASITSAPVSLHSSTSTHSAEPTPVAAPEATAPVAIPIVLATRDAAIAVGDPAFARETGSTLLIQQTPEVIRVSERHT
uniref:Serine/threonine-protein phosphatase 2A regulatory subunit B'' subunit alpha n=1 Tax=Dicentrarchus labrax TaxID=13489 RepID=A0A8P4G1Z2_DICLA